MITVHRSDLLEADYFRTYPQAHFGSHLILLTSWQKSEIALALAIMELKHVNSINLTPDYDLQHMLQDAVDTNFIASASEYEDEIEGK